MQNFLSTKKDIETFISDKNFKKIFVLCGKISFEKSGSKDLLENLLKIKETKFFFKKSFIPDYDELTQIVLSHYKELK